MHNSFNKEGLTSANIKLSGDYIQQDSNTGESLVKKGCSVIETQHLVDYVSAIRSNNTKSVTFLINIGVNQESNEIKKLNAIIEGEPILTFVTSGS